MTPPRADVVAVAIAECFRGDGETLCNAIGTMQSLGGRLAKASFEPDLVITDGFAHFAADVFPVGDEGRVPVESWNPYAQMFSVVWNGRRHVMMGGSQIDQYGNHNFACIGDWKQPKAQLLGFRGAPGNTINNTTSYFMTGHSPKVFVPKVDVVCGIGYDRAAELGEHAARFHEIRRVVSDLAVLDFETADGTMRLRSVHPGVTVDEVVEATGFELAMPEGGAAAVPESRIPTDDELEWLERLDPQGLRHKEVPTP
jgi:acyl CoA:acetate/3-ketoacid CoA transferase beta subunit